MRVKPHDVHIPIILIPDKTNQTRSSADADNALDANEAVSNK